MVKEEAAVERRCGRGGGVNVGHGPSRETGGLRSSFVEDGVDDAEDPGSFVGVELQYLPNENGG